MRTEGNAAGAVRFIRLEDLRDVPRQPPLWTADLEFIEENGARRV